MKRILITGLLAAFLVLSTGALYAWDEGPYLGFGLGATSYDLDVEDYDDGNIVSGSGSVDTSDTGFKIFGGYRFTPNLAVELYFADLGDTTFRGVADVPDVDQQVHWCDGRVSSEVSADGLGLSMLGNVPVSRAFNLYGKFGIFASKARARETDSCGFFRDSDSDTGLMFGVGMAYQVDYRTAVQLEWERYTDIFDSFDVDFVSLGLTFYLY